MAVITAERIKEIENLANDFFVSKKGPNKVVADNLYTYCQLACLLCNNLPNFKKDEGYDFEPYTFARKTPIENIEIVVNFYKMHGIDLDVNQLVNNGTIEFVYREHKKISTGKNYYGPNNAKLIDTCNNGLVTDSITLVHELSHFRNQEDGGRPIAGDLLSETIAYAEEFVFLDYLKIIGFEYEAQTFKKYIYNVCVKLAKDMLVVFKIGLLFRDVESLSKDNYAFYFGDSINYEAEMQVVDNYLRLRGNPKKDAEYIMAYALGTYMYYEYRNNPQYMSIIQSLHDLVNTQNLLVCFQTMGLGALDDKDLEKIEKSLRFVSSEIEKNPVRNLM